MRGGVLDQLASTLPDAGTAVLIDCRDLSWRPIPLPTGAGVVIMDTGTRRVLADSAYGERRDSCLAAAAQLGLPSLRDAAFEQLASLRDDYDVSGPAVDAMVETALHHPACFGARMTGGGFAGCAVALVDTTATRSFCDEVASSYHPPPTQPAEAPVRFWPVGPAAGASVVVPGPG